MGCIWEHVSSSQVQSGLTEKYSTAREVGFQCQRIFDESAARLFELLTGRFYIRATSL